MRKQLLARSSTVVGQKPKAFDFGEDIQRGSRNSVRHSRRDVSAIQGLTPQVQTPSN